METIYSHIKEHHIDTNHVITLYLLNTLSILS